MSLTNKVLYDIDQSEHIKPEQKAIARKNIGAYEDKTKDGGIPKEDLAKDVQASLNNADSIDKKVLRMRYEKENTLRFYRGNSI